MMRQNDIWYHLAPLIMCYNIIGKQRCELLIMKRISSVLVHIHVFTCMLS